MQLLYNNPGKLAGKSPTKVGEMYLAKFKELAALLREMPRPPTWLIARDVIA